MKRHPALEPLSDDHHGALVLARAMRRAGSVELADAGAAWQDARRRFEAEIAPHFRLEEEVLLPALEAAGEGDLAARVREEHARLRGLVDAQPTAANAAEFGALLHDHVRFEERTLFPRAEAVLSPAALAAIARAARRAAARS